MTAVPSAVERDRVAEVRARITKYGNLCCEHADDGEDMIALLAALDAATARAEKAEKRAEGYAGDLGEVSEYKRMAEERALADRTRADEATAALAATREALVQLDNWNVSELSTALFVLVEDALSGAAALAATHNHAIRKAALLEAADHIARTWPTTSAVHERNDVGSACMYLRSLAEKP